MRKQPFLLGGEYEFEFATFTVDGSLIAYCFVGGVMTSG